MSKFLKKFFKSSFDKAYNQGYIDCLNVIYQEIILGYCSDNFEKYIGNKIYCFTALNDEPPLGYTSAEVLKNFKKYHEKRF